MTPSVDPILNTYIGSVPQGINFDLLNQQVLAVFPTVKLNGGGTSIQVYFQTPPADLVAAAAQLDAIFAAHDPTVKTTAQTQNATADTAAANLHAQAISEAQFWETLTAGSITTVPQAVALIVRLGKVCAAIIRVLLRKGIV